jgi:hypothetical protein
MATGDPQNFWTCPQCQVTLKAWTTTGLAISQRLHLDYHQRRKPEDGWRLTEGSVADPETGVYRPWSDSAWLTDLAINPFGQDERLEAELAARYKPKS